MDAPRPLPVPRSTKVQGIAAVLLAAYLVVLAAAVWLPLPLDRPPLTNDPAYQLRLTRPDLTAWDFGRNVAMTVPFGLLLPLVVRWRYEAMVLACVGVTMVAETGQYLGSVAVGWDWRAFDVNDLLANAVGGWIGLASTGAVLAVAALTRRRRAGRRVRVPRPHRWVVGAGAAALVTWVVAASASTSATGVLDDVCEDDPGTAATSVGRDARAWAGGQGWVCLSLDGSTASVPPTAPRGAMISQERPGGVVHVGVSRAGDPATVRLPDGRPATVDAVAVAGTPLRVWSVREPAAG